MTIKVFLADDHAVVRDGLKALLEAEENISVIGVAADGRVVQSRPNERFPCGQPAYRAGGGHGRGRQPATRPNSAGPASGGLASGAGRGGHRLSPAWRVSAGKSTCPTAHNQGRKPKPRNQVFQKKPGF